MLIDRTSSKFESYKFKLNSLKFANLFIEKLSWSYSTVSRTCFALVFTQRTKQFLTCIVLLNSPFVSYVCSSQLMLLEWLDLVVYRLQIKTRSEASNECTVTSWVSCCLSMTSLASKLFDNGMLLKLDGWLRIDFKWCEKSPDSWLIALHDCGANSVKLTRQFRLLSKCPLKFGKKKMLLSV